jgi:tRNA-dihydrouridine synthase
LDHHAVRRLANDFPELRVTLNGGINSFQEESSMLDGVMAGRWFLRRPFDLCDSKEGKIAAVRAFGDYLAGESSSASQSQLAMPLLLLCEQLRDDEDDEDDGDEDLHRELARTTALVTGINHAGSLKRLSKALSKTIGTKVANKILRNRAE